MASSHLNLLLSILLAPVVSPELAVEEHPTSGFAGGIQDGQANASNGSIHFVVWQDNRNSINQTNWDIYGARVDGNGNVLDNGGIPISTDKRNQRNPSVSFSGKYFIVAWQDDRNSVDQTNWDIYGARVEVSGSVRRRAKIT